MERSDVVKWAAEGLAMIAGMGVCIVIGVALFGCLPAEQPDEVVLQETTAEGLRATATAGLKALAAMTPLEAAGVLQQALPERGALWHWAPPSEGSPVDHYRFTLTGVVRDTTLGYWFSTWPCSTEALVVEGVDAAGRVGPGSLPGVCENAAEGR